MLSSFVTTYLLLLTLSLCSLPVSAEVVQVQIIHRHGARPPLDKNPTNTSREFRPGILYPDGIKQLSGLGAYVRKTYITGDSDSVIKAMPKETPERGDIIARTSNFYRTIISSRAFLDEVYPDQYVVPRVFENEKNDWMLRGYSLCPTLDKRFAEFRESDTFKNKQKEKPDGETETNEEFVARVANQFEDFRNNEDRASFFNVWAVHDRYLIIQNDGYGLADWRSVSPKLDNVEKLSQAEMLRLKDLADWHEIHKFDYGVHNIHLSGGLLRMIMNQARGMIDSRERRPPHRIIEYSAHYPTLLALFGSLRAKNTEKNVFPANKIPGFGAAIIFELNKEGDEDYVMKLKWWEGDGEGDSTGSDIKFTPFAIGRQPCTNAEEGCSFAQMERMLALDDLGAEVFCEECASSADVCKVPRSQEVGGSSTTEMRCGTGTKLASGAVGVGAGLLFGILLAFGYFTLNARRKRNRMAMSDREYETEGDFMG